MSSVEFQASELFIIGYEGTALSEPLRSRYSRGDFAGLIFFARNFADLTDISAIAEQLDELAQLYQVSSELARLPPILSIDHEGGRVQRIKAPLTVFPPMATLADKPPAAAEAVGRVMARELSALGLNLNFAPVLDVRSNPQNPVIGDRAFGVTPEAVSERALAFLSGLECPGTDGGVLRGCGKHFPGHGDTATDSHFALPVVTHPIERLRAVELLPFARAVKAGFGMLMTAHVVYPAVDDRPATLSRRWLTDILRGELGFDGVILSDDLDMRALHSADLYQLIGDDDGQIVVESLLAGCDAFLLCRDAERQARAEAALQRAAAERSDVRSRLCESVERLRRFRATLRFPAANRSVIAELSSGSPG
jgi:beta-N-acetylhexosaminidase